MSTRIKRRRERILSALWEWLWPRRCALCRELLGGGGEELFCPVCAAGVRPFMPPLCVRCGRPLIPDDAPAAGVCGECELTPPLFEQARAYGEYAGTLAEAMKRFKYNQDRSFVDGLRRLMAEADDRWFSAVAADVVVPVPLHPARLAERGFNPATDLAQAAARRRGIPLLYSALLRLRNTPSQAGLSFSQRKANVRAAFHVSRPELITKKTILLIDDVFTTGATVSECAHSLLKADAEAVFVLTLCRTL